MTQEERLMAFVIPEPNSGCWLWDGAVYASGYGAFKASNPRRQMRAHRASYELFCGPIPAGKVLDHLCRVKSCVNPRHLEAVTSLENTRRGSRAQMTVCIRGHAFDYAFRGKRGCKICRLEACRKHRRIARELAREKSR